MENNEKIEETRNFFVRLISADSPESSKRLIAIIGALFLFVTMAIIHSDTLVYCVTAIVIGGLAINGAENIVKTFKQ